MTLDEAIKYMAFALASFPEGTDPKYIESYKLGIEALKAVQCYRGVLVIDKGRLLPGETKD